MSISPLDGRYKGQVQELAPLFSEYALQKYRIFVELEFLKTLSEKGIIPQLSKQNLQSIHRVYTAFNEKEFEKIKEIELKINHDVKAVEYYLREQFKKAGLKQYVRFIHIGLTSEDTNNLAYSLIMKETREKILIPLLQMLLSVLKKVAQSTKHVPMLGRTHGQPAVPTTFGKEMANYYFRLKKQLLKLEQFTFEGKLNGAVGNYNALQFVFPTSDWMSISSSFIKSFGLKPNPATTQILFSDNLVEFFQTMSLINGILVDFSINIWEYIMLEVIVQKKDKGQVGSSTMPQKINPIRFENAEGVLQLANSQFEFYARKLLSSRLQRDLSDSTVKRSFGTSVAYSVVGWKNILSGLKTIRVNEHATKADLDRHWEVLGEALQTYLRSIGDEKAYEKLKKLIQGKVLSKENYMYLLKKLSLEKEKKLVELTPKKYTGLAEKLTEKIIRN